MKRISTLGVLTLVVLAGVLGLKVRAAFAENIIENIGGVQALPVVSYVTSSSNETWSIPLRPIYIVERELQGLK